MHFHCFRTRFGVVEFQAGHSLLARYRETGPITIAKRVHCDGPIVR